MRPKKNVKTAVALVVSLLLVPGVSHALKNDQKALVGLKALYVVVEDINPEAELLGLTETQIQTDVELRLRKAGVRLLTKEEWEKTPGTPYLYVNVNTPVKQNLPLVAYSIRVALLEWVTLARGLQTTGTIWSKDSVGIAGTKKIKEIRPFIGDLVDMFINDYLAANPKK